MRIRDPKVLFLPLAVMLLLGGCGSGTDDRQVLEETLTVTPRKTIPPQEQAAISRAAARVLQRIATARGELHKGAIDEARAELQEADQHLKMIAEASPSVEVKDRIWAARKHLEYETTEEVSNDLVPIYKNLSWIADLLPTEATEQHLHKASKHLQQGEREAAANELRSAEDALVYSEIDLPVRATRESVQVALAALDKKDIKQADQALHKIEETVDIIAAASSPARRVSSAGGATGQSG